MSGAGGRKPDGGLSQGTMCPHGGFPGQHHLDNGLEYSALPDAMARRSVLADMPFGVTLAKPCSPTSKGMIEGRFNGLEGIFKGLPGWIGCDRTNKKSASIGNARPAKATLPPKSHGDVRSSDVAVRRGLKAAAKACRCPIA